MLNCFPGQVVALQYADLRGQERVVGLLGAEKVIEGLQERFFRLDINPGGGAVDRFHFVRVNGHQQREDESGDQNKPLVLEQNVPGRPQLAERVNLLQINIGVRAATVAIGRRRYRTRIQGY